MRQVIRNVLYRFSDWLCAHQRTFELGNWLGELGWKLR